MQELLIGKEVEQSEISKGEFKELAKAAYPHVEAIRELIAEKGLDSLCNITLSADGYIDFSVHESGWRMSRFKNGEAPVMEHNFRERLDVF